METRKIEDYIRWRLVVANSARTPPPPDYSTNEARVKDECAERLGRHPDPKGLFRRLRAEHDSGAWDHPEDPSAKPIGALWIQDRADDFRGIVSAGELLSWDPLWLLLVPVTAVVGVGIALAIRARRVTRVARR